MNGYERTIAMLDGGEVDLIPRAPILMAFATHFIGHTYADFASDWRVLVEANLRCAEHFGFDQVSCISDPYRETQGFGAEIQYVTDGVPRCAKAPLEEDKDLARLKRPDPHTSERMRDRVQACEGYRERAFKRYSILGWVEGPAAEAADLRGVGNFLMDLLIDPEYAAQLMDRCVEVGIEFAQAQIEGGADTIGVGDAVASQVSTETYRELIFPREKKLIDGIHQAGGRARLHICGNTTHLLASFAELGVDIVDLDWQVDLAEARSILKPHQAICGNLNPVASVMQGTPEAIENEVREACRKAGRPYLIGAGCEIPPGTPEANLMALCRPVTSNR